MKQKRLYLSNDRFIGGVCGGIAEYLDIDPTIVRLAWILITFFNTFCILIYIAAVLIVPANPNQETSNERQVVSQVRDSFDRFTKSDSDSEQNSLYRSLGLILLAIGAIILLNRFIPAISWQVLVSLILIGLGIVLIKS